MNNKNIINLYPLISELIKPFPHHTSIKQFVNICHKISISYLRIKIKNHKLNLSSYGASLNDFSLDAISDLFKRNDNGIFSELQIFFGKNNFQTKSDIELFSLLRQLCFGSINQFLFKNFNQFNKSIGKIIRNIKIRAKEISSLEIRKINDVNFLIISSGDNNSINHFIMPPEIMASMLYEKMKSNSSTTEILNFFKKILIEQDIYAKYFPLIILAEIINDFYISINCRIISEDISNSLFEFEINSFLEKSIEKIKNEVGMNYVRKNKISEDLFCKYFSAIKSILSSEFIDNFNDGKSYYEYFKDFEVDLTFNNYQKYHRNKIEYLAKLTREEFLKSIKREF